MLFIAIAVAVAVASRVNLNYYSVQPGVAQPVQQFISVPAGKGHPVAHSVLLTDVEIGRVSALSYLYYKTQANTDLLPLEAITGGTPPSEFGAQGNLEMSQAESAAKTAAFRRLGYRVGARPAGAVVFATYRGTPAFKVLDVADVITAVDGTATPSAEGLVSALRHYHSGQTVTLSVEHGGRGTPKPVSITLKRTLVDIGGGVMRTEDLGVQVENQIDYTYPFPVRINITNI
ncbi:MAG: PDZ domain-containing protein, partial [Acidimicrobiales bacterium]